jgi:hypothetical protein
MRQLLFIVFLVVFVSCESKVKYKKPDNLISREEMINLLIDMHIARGTATVKKITDDEEKNYMGLVYEKYQIDSTRFAESNFYYLSNIEEYQSNFKEDEKEHKKIQEHYTIIEDSESKKALDSILERQKNPKMLGRDDIVK